MGKVLLSGRFKFFQTVNIVFFGFVITFLFIDSFFYPGASLRYSGFDPKTVLLFYAFLLFTVAFLKIRAFPEWFIKLNKKILFPFLVLISVFFICFEFFVYENAVLSYLKFHYLEFIALTVPICLVGYLFEDKQSQIMWFFEKFIPVLLFLFFGVLGKPFLFILYLPVFLAVQNNIKAFRMTNRQWLIFLYPLLFLISVLTVFILSEDDFITITKEDGLLEYFQVLSYFAAGIIFFKISRRLKSKSLLMCALYVVIALVLFFVAIEEISWGQRILGIKTPGGIKEINIQNELTFHNLESIQRMLHAGYMIIGLGGAFGWIWVKKLKPVPPELRHYLAPPPFLSLYFFAVFVHYFMYDFILNKGILERVNRWQEAAETLLAAGFLFFALFLLKQKKIKSP